MRKNPPRLAPILLVAAFVFRSGPLSAHHEAIFGSQSSLVLSADKFVSIQAFSRTLDDSGTRTRETTTLVSAGVRVSKRLPLTFTAVLPYSWIAARGRTGTAGAEDAVLGARYRYDLKGLQERWQRDGNYLMGMGAVELNNGTIDHAAWNGPPDSLAAVLGSLERGEWSLIGYSVGRFNVRDAVGNKDGDNLSFGGGLAFTPHENFATGRLFSYQAGWSFEHFSRDRVAGQADPNSGSNELLVHPTFVYSPGHGLMFFGVASLPVWQDFRDSATRDRFRVGTGVLYSW
jgi:hypothetical protein